MVDAVGSSGKKVEYGGKEYDFVFDVDIEDGKPPLKLPYKLSQNPYEAATKFIENNELPITYLDTVADFITTNTKGATIGQSQTQAPAQAGSDPWGSEDRYRPGGDTSSTHAATPPKPKVIPQKDYLSILVASVPKMQKKIEELNTVLVSDGHKDLSLNPTELHILSTLCRQLATTSGTTKALHPVTPGGLDLAIKLSTAWPYADRLPGLDLLRLLAVTPEMALYAHPSSGQSIVDVLIVGATEAESPAENHIMMSARAFANLFGTLEGRALALREFSKITTLLSTSLSKGSKNRNLLVAATTVYINYAVLLSTSNESTFDHSVPLLETLADILNSQSDAEVVYRALVAVGTLCTVDEEVRDAAKDVYGIGPVVDGVVGSGKVADPRCKGVVEEIRVLLA